MKEKITIDSRDAEALIQDLEGWAETLESEGEHPWVEDMQRHARMLRDKLLGRVA